MYSNTIIKTPALEQNEEIYNNENNENIEAQSNKLSYHNISTSNAHEDSNTVKNDNITNGIIGTHCILLIILTGIVGASSKHTITTGWIFLLEDTHVNAGMFSVVNSSFFCLATQAISVSFSLCLISSSKSTHWLFKRIALAILVIYGVLFLFIQGEWFIPPNNLLVVEILYMFGLFIIGMFSEQKKNDNLTTSYTMRIVCLLMTTPLLAVSVLCASG